MKKRSFYLSKGSLWRLPLSLSLFLVAPNVQTFAKEQIKSISVQLSDVSLKEAMNRIESVSGYSFFYDENDIDLSARVSLNASNESLINVLDAMLKSTGLTYEISKNQIVLYAISSENNNSTLSSSDRIQQSRVRIQGTIVDEMGQPVIGANIVEKGTTNGTISDMDGKFTLSVAEGSSIEITYIGFVNQLVKTPVGGVIYP